MNEINNQQIFDNEIEYYLQEFCQVNKIENLKTESQSVWNSCLIYIQRHVFPDNSKLKQQTAIYGSDNIPTTNNAYNYELLHAILDYYIYLCNLYDKEISIMGYSKLTKIDYQLIMEWGNNYNNTNKVSSLSKEIYKRLITEREDSLSSKLATGNKNPVGVLAILNRHYQWNLPGVSKEPSKQALSAAELPQLGQKV